MPELKVELVRHHLTFTDGCEMNTSRSNVVDNPKLKWMERGLDDNQIDKRKYLFVCSIAIANNYYEANQVITIKCPTCR